MPPALALTQITVRYVAGVAGCTATVTALDSVDLHVWPHEVVGIFGGAGAGKSTLLLCAARLLRPRPGTVRWFGRQGIVGANGCAIYVRPGPDAVRRTLAIAPSPAPRIVLLDDPFCGIAGPDYARLEQWIVCSSRHGDAVIVTARER